MITNPSFYLVAVPAVILLGLSKGGFTGVSMIAMPLISLQISPILGASIILPILIVQDVISVWAYRREWDRRNLSILLPGACLGVVLGYVFAARVSDAAVALAVGTISVVFSVRRLIVERRSKTPPSTKPSAVLGVLWGTVSGFTSMIANAGAPPFQVYVLPQRLKRDVFVGTGVIFFATVNWIKVPFFIALGQFSRQNLTTSLVLFPLAIASTWAGVLLVRRVSPERFYTLIYILLLSVGSKLLWDGCRVFVFGG
jgi:hypothetical protein